MGLKLVTLNKKQRTIIEVGDLMIGEKPVVIAGPCSVENMRQMARIAGFVKERGAHILRGGAFKPRTSPYSFQGLGVEGLKILKKVSKRFEIPVVTELMDTKDLKKVSRHCDIIQIGSRNMQNFSLLKAVGKAENPVMLKRGMNATIDEWLNAAEYIMLGGNENVILCERGIRTFETKTRNTLDLSAVPILKGLTHLPVIVDPSHGTGKKSLVIPMSKASFAAGADGIMVEVHNCPESAKSDGDQSLTLKEFEKFMKEIEGWL